MDLLGSVLWFNIADAQGPYDEYGQREVTRLRVNKDQLAQWFAEFDLNPALIPHQARAGDAFRTASSDLTVEYASPDLGGLPARLVVVQVASNAQFTVRHVLRHAVDARGQRTSSAKVAELKFFKGRRTARGRVTGTEDVRVRMSSFISDEEAAYVRPLLEEFDRRFREMVSHYSVHVVREVVRTYVRYLNAILLKASGGVYFVHLDRVAELDALATVVSRFGGACRLHQVPLVDTPAQRAMLQGALTEEVQQACWPLMRDVRLVQATNEEVPLAEYRSLYTRYQEILEGAEEHVARLDLRLDVPALSEAHDALLELLRRLPVEARR